MFFNIIYYSQGSGTVRVYTSSTQRFIKVTGNYVPEPFFKETDRNRSSFHHPKWINNIPKGQLMRMHHNCESEGDYY